jgi:hypothetical protein
MSSIRGGALRHLAHLVRTAVAQTTTVKRKLGPLERGPVVTINRTSFQVVGSIEQSPRLPQLQGELLVPEDTPGFVNPERLERCC